MLLSRSPNSDKAEGERLIVNLDHPKYQTNV